MLNKNFGRNAKCVLAVSLVCIMHVVTCSEKSSQESSKEQSKKTTVDTLKTDITNKEKPEVIENTDTAEKKTEDDLVSESPKALTQPASKPSAAKMVPLDIKLPKPMFVGTPQNFRVAKLEKPLGRPRPPFLAPAGTKNVAFKKSIASTDDAPIIGEIAMITDGDKEAAEGSYVELGPFLQHITIDLGAKHDIYAILFWHFHKQARVYFDVIVQVADDSDFTTNVHTLFNNDHDNSAGFGVGQDLHYVETSEGRLVDAKGVQARYVRLYSNGNTNNDLNHYIEVEVYGKPVRSM
ncbi:MAG: hypothetical protein ACE5JB_14710 [bacterium]